jgi:hypothetical protein
MLQLVTVYFFFIETKGATLEEISRTFDGEDAVEEMKVHALATEKVDMVEQVEYLNNKEGIPPTSASRSYRCVREYMLYSVFVELRDSTGLGDRLQIASHPDRWKQQSRHLSAATDHEGRIGR